MTIKAITFDFWSTLYKARSPDYIVERLQDLKKSLDRYNGYELTADQFQAAADAANRIWVQTWLEEQRTLPAAEWVDILLTELEISLAAEPLAEIILALETRILQERPIPAPNIEPVLVELSADYRLGVISDTGLTPARLLRQILREDGLLDYFAHLTFSGELGRSKPHPDTFLSTLQALDAQPAEAVHIGDLLQTDIAGARQVGMYAIQYTGINRDETELAINPDAVIADHTELKPLLKQWSA